MFNFLHFILTIITIIFFSILINNNYKKIRLRLIFQLLIIEIIVAYFFIYSNFGLYIINILSIIFDNLAKFSNKGTDFVFGNLEKQNLALFFLKTLCPIVFISTIIGILRYINVLPFIIRNIGNILSKINGMGKLESFNAISSLFLGQSENFILYKDILSEISEHRLYSLAITAMSTVSMSIVSSYMTILIPKYIILALILNMFSTFVILSLINPYYSEKKEDLKINLINKNQSFFDMLYEYILTGFKIVIIVSSMIMGFVALISAINELFIFFLGISFQEIIGYIFFPIAWIIGFPVNEALKVGNVMATKLVSNEFIAMMKLKEISNTLSPHSIGMISVFLVSFSNFSSIGIIIGAIKSLNKKQGKIISRYGFKLIYASTLVSILSASIVGLII